MHAPPKHGGDGTRQAVYLTRRRGNAETRARRKSQASQHLERGGSGDTWACATRAYAEADACFGNPGTDGAASGFPAKGVANQLQGRQSPGVCSNGVLCDCSAESSCCSWCCIWALGPTASSPGNTISGRSEEHTS